MSIGDVYKDVFRNIDDNQVIWIANAPFEAKKLGTIGALTGTTEDIRSQLSYAPRYSDDLLYVSEPSVMAARSRATATGDWTGVWNAIEGMDPNAPGKKVLDVLDVVRAAQSYGGLIAAKAGFNVDNHGDQVALSVQSRIMGLGPEIHKATQDNLLSAIVGKQAATHISAYKGMLERTHMATGTALRVETAQEADAMNWLWRMHKLKTSTSQHYMKYSTIAKAMQIKRENTLKVRLQARLHNFFISFINENSLKHNLKIPIGLGLEESLVRKYPVNLGIGDILGMIGKEIDVGGQPIKIKNNCQNQ